MKWLRNLASSLVKLLILPTGSEVNHVRARPVKVIGKNLHSSTGSVVYKTMRFLYATICSSGHWVPVNGGIVGIFILAGFGVARMSADKGEFSSIGASLSRGLAEDSAI